MAVLGTIALIAASMYVSAMLKGGVPSRYIAIGAGIAALVYAVVVLFVIGSRRAGAVAYIRDHASPWGVAVAECTRDAKAFWSESRVDATWRRLLDRPDRPRTIVDSELAEVIATIPMHADLLEPEPIAQSERGLLIPAALFLWLAVTSYFDRRPDIWWRVIVFSGLSIWFLSRVPEIRNRVPLLRETGRDLVAGPGWLRRRDGLRWTAADSMAIVMRQAHRGRPKGVIIRFIGPIGVRDVSFASVGTRDFALLWQRWMHPQPRLDLSA